MTNVLSQPADQGSLTAQEAGRPTFEHGCDIAVDQERLTADEDARLRLLTALAAFGELSRDADDVRAALRQRDRRAYVREPEGFEPVASAAAQYLAARVEPATGSAAPPTPAGPAAH